MMTDPSNIFETIGDRQISAPRKARLRAVETRRARKQEKELAERDTLHRLWKKWRAERVEQLTKMHPSAVELCTFLERITFDDGEEILERAHAWADKDVDTRFLVLSLIDHAVINLREKLGLPFADDALPFSDEEPNLFLLVREVLR